MAEVMAPRAGHDVSCPYGEERSAGNVVEADALL